MRSIFTSRRIAMKNSRTLFIGATGTLFFLSVVNSQSSYPGSKASQRSVEQKTIPADSLFSLPHERYFQKLYDRTSGTQHLMPVPRRMQQTTTSFPNINLSINDSAQNEPSVKISRVHPNRVVAAWRDFRTGMNPNPIRRIGYSYSTDARVTWAPPALLASFNATYPRTSDPPVGVAILGNF